MKTKLFRKVRKRFKIIHTLTDVVLLDRDKKCLNDTKQFGHGFSDKRKYDLLVYEAMSQILGFYTFLQMCVDRNKRRKKRLFKKLSSEQFNAGNISR